MNADLADSIYSGASASDMKTGISRETEIIMDAAEAKKALKADQKKRQTAAETILKAAFEKIGELGFTVTPVPVCLPGGNGVHVLAAQIQLTPKQTEG